MPHHEELIDQDLTLSSNMVSRFKPTVTNGATLTVESGVKIDMYNSEIVINQGCSLVLDHDITIQAKKGICKLIIDGNITVGSNVHFYAEGESQLWLQINNQLVNLGIVSGDFDNTALITYNNNTNISSSTFDGSAIYGFNGSYSISDCDFSSSITRFVGDGLSRVEDPMISFTNDCRFSDVISNAIEIDNYPNFRIQNCSVSNSYNGIMLSNSGFGKGDQLVIGNVITGNTNTAITSYRSYVDILNNTIDNNNVGIISFNRSVTHIEGDTRNGSQIIKDNGSYEILASEDSFPQYLQWNLIQDDDNLPGDPLVKYTGTNYSLDVVNNCWDLSFNPNDDLSPAGHYSWSPVWNCSLGHGTAYNSITESLYLDAINKIDSGDYANAKSEFQGIVLTDPTSEYAKAALKEMLSLEEYDENNYQDLKSYYASDSSILNTPELTKLSDFLINFCEIKMENWPTAIDWFENEIINPESFEDSIFAIIDLGYTYFLMENNGLKSSYSGKLTEYVPTSRGQFEIKRDYLLSLLPGDQLHKSQNEGLNSFAEGELLQNIPNPFSGTTQIYYTIDFESDIQLNIYDNIGQLIITISQGNQPKGKHFVEFDATGLPGGVYFYSLLVNGIPDSSRKMMVLH